MADAPYKGLTIRFGADITEFTSRMSALNKIIGSTQTRLNQLSKAMRGDPEGVELLKQKMIVLREQTANAALKVDALRKGIQAMNEAGIDRMAAGMKDTALNVQRADARVKACNKSLNEYYDRLKEIGEQVGISFRKDELDKFYAKMEESKTASEALKREVRDIAVQVGVLKKQHEMLDAEREKAKQIHEYKTMTTELKLAESQLTAFAREVVSTNERLASMAGNAKKFDELGAEIRELRTESNALDNTYRSLSQTVRKSGKDTDAYKRAIDVAAERIRNAARQVENLQEQLRMRQAQTGLEHVAESMAKLKANVVAAREAAVQAERNLAEYRAKTDAAKQSWDSLHRQIKTVIQNTTQLTEKQRQWLGITKEEEDEYRALKAQIDGSSEKIRELAARAKAAGEELELKKGLVAQKQLQLEIPETGAKLTALTAKAKAFGAAALNAVRDFSTGLGATLGPALLMTGLRVVTAGDQIDSAFRDMKKTVDGTAEDFEHLREAAVEFSRVHPVSADTILEVESLGGQLGITVDKLEKFAEVVSNLDIATNLSADTAATQLGQLNNILHWGEMQFDDGRDAMERYGDALVRLGNNMPTQEDRISSITMAIASTSQVMGMTTPEILGWATAIAATGQGAESSGTAISNTMIDIEAAVGEGGDALEAFAEIANMSAEEFAQKWKDKPSEAMFDFVSGLKDLSDAGESATMRLDELEIRGVRQVRALLSLGETIDIVKKAQDLASDAWEHGGDAAREASQKAEGFSGKLKMLKNTAQTMGDAFASKLVPLMDNLLDLLRGAAKVIDDMDEGFATAITLSSGFFVALGPVARMVSQTTITFRELKRGMTEASIAAKALNTVIAEPGASQAALGEMKANASGLAKALASLATPAGAAKIAIAAVVAGLTALGVAIWNYYQEQEKYRKATDGLKEALYLTGDAADESARRFADGGVSYESCTKQVKNLIDEHARLYDELQKTNKDAKASVKVMENYADAVKKYNGTSKDSLADAERLRNAVKQLNEQYGLGLELKEEDNNLYVVGADGVRMETDAINNLVDAKRREIEMNAIANMQQALVEQQIKDQDLLTEAKKQTAIAQQEYNDAINAGDDLIEEYRLNYEKAIENEQKAQEALDGTTDALKVLDAQYTITSEAVDEHGRKVKELADEFPVLASELASISEHEFATFIDTLEESGYSTQDLRKLSTAEILKMTESWRNGTGEWRHAMEVAHDRMATEARSTDSEVEAAYQEMKSGALREISVMTNMSVEELEKLADAAGVDSELAMKKWVGGIKAAKADSKNAAKSNADIVNEELAKAKKYAEDTGAYVSQGFARGISGSGYLVSAAARAVVSAAIAAGNDEAAVSSPSRKTMWTGEMMGEGYLVGMGKKEDAIEKEGALLSNLALGAGSAGSSATLGNLASRAAASMVGTTSNTTNNSTTNEYVNLTLNVEARDLRDMQTIDDLVAMAKRARAQYA